MRREREFRFLEGDLDSNNESRVVVGTARLSVFRGNDCASQKALFGCTQDGYFGGAVAFLAETLPCFTEREFRAG